MHLRANLAKWLKLISGDIRRTIVGMVVVALLATGGGLLAMSKTAVDFSILVLNIRTPLWATILLILLCAAYTYVRTAKRQSSQATSLPYRIKYFTVDALKWKTRIYREDYFEMDDNPICVMHDLSFVYRDNFYRCPADNCANRISSSHYFQVYETAKSYIEKRVRNHEY